MKHIHFIGIKGVGMAPLAVIAKQAGFAVSGCDSTEGYITDSFLENEGIKPLPGFDPRHLDGVDLVITTGAHGGFENKEVKSAAERGLKILTQGHAVGAFMKGDLLARKFKGISVAGCHGKTTTSALIATLLRSAELDPSYVVGTSDVPSLNGSGHLGKGEYFIAEADEYATEPKFDKTAKFLWQYPSIMVITNIEFDHPDIYKNISEVFDAYRNFSKNLTEEGIMIINGDDEYCQKLVENNTKNIQTFGKNAHNNFLIKNIKLEADKSSFNLFKKDQKIGKFSISLSGEHNIFNAAATIIVGLCLGLDNNVIQKGLSLYKGSKRRMELLGTTKKGAVVYDDYAHHPTEIRKTLEGLRFKFEDKKIVCIFQPHTFLRTKILFDDFIYSFNNADQVIITDIYASKRETQDINISSKNLADKIKKEKNDIVYIPTLDGVVEYLKQKNYNSDFILVSMGAGDIYKIWKNLL